MKKYFNRVVLTHAKIWELWFNEPVIKRVINNYNNNEYLYWLCVSQILNNLIESDNV